MTIAGALSSVLLKATTSLSLRDIADLAQRYEEERFQVREHQVRLKAHFQSLLERATESGRYRMVFFIDDLDRCVPEQILRMLEALKLYLNLPNCIYFLGVDRGGLESSIKQRYKDLDVHEAEYLDKIVQLPFAIPPISEESIGNFIAPLLPEPLLPSKDILMRGLGDNPRQVKRFVNTLILNHRMASELIREQYDPTVLALVLLIQYRQPSLFKILGADPALLHKLQSGSKGTQEIFDKYVASDDRLKSVLQQHIIPRTVHVAPYIYLTQVARVREAVFDVILKEVGPNKINVIRVIREITNFGLKEAKDLADKTPSTIVREVEGSVAETFKKKFEDVGASVELS